MKYHMMLWCIDEREGLCNMPLNLSCLAWSSQSNHRGTLYRTVPLELVSHTIFRHLFGRTCSPFQK